MMRVAVSRVQCYASAGPILAGLPAVVALTSQEKDQLLFALVVCLAGLAAGGYFLSKAWDRYTRGATVKNTVPERVRSIALGRTEIQGEAVPLEKVVKTPFTNERCFYASWVIEEYKKDNDDSKSWETIDSGAYGYSFCIDDGTGEVPVDIFDGHPSWQFSDECRDSWRDSFFIRALRALPVFSPFPRDTVGQFCAKRGIEMGRWKKRRYTQTYLPVGCETYVFGEATPIESTEEYMTDADSDLKITRHGGTDKFLISDKDEVELVRGYNLQALKYVLIGTIPIVLGLTILTTTVIGVL